MQSATEDERPEGGRKGDVDLLIEKGFLLLGSIEFEIEEHLMSHGTRIDPETRFFMARVRDAAGGAASKMIEEARSRLESEAEAPGADETAGAGIERTEGSLVPAESDARDDADPDGRRPRFGRAPVAALGLATMAVIAALFVPGSVEKTGESAGDHQAIGVDAPVVAAIAREAVAALDERTGPAADPKPGPVVDSSPPATPARVRQEPEADPPELLAQAADDAPTGAGHYRRLAETMAVALHSGKAGEQPPYPDPRAGPEETAPAPERAIAAAEERLALSANARREVQRRLALARFDPQHFDGIFGPATRTAIGQWQAAAGIAATGYLDAPALALLREQTAADYRAMLAASKARARQKAVRTVLASPVPPASPLRADRCSRTREGTIVYGRSVRCDFRGLRQSISRLFG